MLGWFSAISAKHTRLFKPSDRCCVPTGAAASTSAGSAQQASRRMHD